MKPYSTTVPTIAVPCTLFLLLFITVDPITASAAPPVIYAQPTSQVVPVYGRASFVATATGTPPLSYQWVFNGTDIAGATNSVLNLDSLTPAQSGYYNFEASNAGGDAFSAKAFLDVYPVIMWSHQLLQPTNLPPALTNVVAVAQGGVDGLFLQSDGKLFTWTGLPPLLALPPAASSSIVAVSAGPEANLALRSDGTVVAWGLNSTNVPAGLSNVVAIASGDYDAVAIKSDGTITAWGDFPPAPSGLTDVVAIASGSYQTVAAKSDGTVVAWGSSSNVPSGLSNVIAVASGDYQSLALKADGTVVAWGSGFPLPVGLSNAVAISTAYGISAALRADGSVVVSQGSFLAPGLTNVTAIALGANYAGNAFYGVAVIGTGSPNFTIQPLSRRAKLGDNAQLHARAVGIQPLYYQWTLNGTNVPGATSGDLMLTNMQAKDFGTYQAVASNSLGTAFSVAAWLGFRPVIGLIPADLAAALNTTNLVWDSSPGVGAWFAETNITHDGIMAARSGPITNSQQSVLQTTLAGPGTLTFWWKVSSEEGFDALSFIIDGSNPVLGISGEADWQQQTVAIGAGLHQLDWIYSKDPSISLGQDAGWLDQVSFMPNPPVFDAQPVSQTVWMGSNVLLQASATGAPTLSYQWLKDGTNLAGATESGLIRPQVGRRDGGGYRVLVSNGGGGVLSSNAILIVHVPQVLRALSVEANGTFVITSGDADGGLLQSTDVARFETQTSSNLVDWVALPNSPILLNGNLVILDATCSNASTRFYRVVEH